MTVACILVHGVGTTMWLRHLSEQGRFFTTEMTRSSRFLIIIQSAILMIVLHFIEILIWASAYLLLAKEELPSIEAAVYFSAVTFTTLGYGDITLSSEWRLLSGFEAIGGIVLIGWTTAFLFAVLQKTWSLIDGSDTGR
jgi:voltage-gated potassium channel Kch